MPPQVASSSCSPNFAPPATISAIRTVSVFFDVNQSLSVWGMLGRSHDPPSRSTVEQELDQGDEPRRDRADDSDDLEVALPVEFLLAGGVVDRGDLLLLLDLG